MRIFKIMGSKVTISLMITSFIIVNGCDNITNEKLYSSVPVSAFYKTQDQAQLALNGVYGNLWDIYKDNRLTVSLDGLPGGTLTSYPSPNEFDNFTWTISNSLFQDIWENSYIGINRANTLLDKLDKSKIADNPKSKISGQAKFLRALFYFNMVQSFGGVPLYIHGTKDINNTDKPRNSADEIYKQIITDLQDASNELSPYSEDDHTAGKATSAAAQALLTKVYTQKKKWSKAANAAQKVMDMDVFGLNADYKKVFDPATNNDKENIFSVQYGNGAPSSNLATPLIGYFGPPPTTTKDGTQIEFFTVSAGGTSVQANRSFFDATPDTYRKWQTMRDKMPYYFPVGSSDMVEDTVALDTPFIVKFNYLNTSGALMANVNLPIIRYSDVLLTYAEAVNEANGGPTRQAYEAINKVRVRARGVGTSHEQNESIYPPLSGLSQSAFRDSVLAEEAREFVGEGKRRAALLRHDRYISNAKDRGISGANENTKLFPLPVQEVSRNPKLEQNPGY